MSQHTQPVWIGKQRRRQICHHRQLAGYLKVIAYILKSTHEGDTGPCHERDTRSDVIHVAAVS